MRYSLVVNEGTAVGDVKSTALALIQELFPPGVGTEQMLRKQGKGMSWCSGGESEGVSTPIARVLFVDVRVEKQNPSLPVGVDDPLPASWRINNPSLRRVFFRLLFYS